MNRLEGLNDKQKEAVLATDGPVLILAGAGSGKTRVLTHRIAYLIEQCGVNPWNIMAITFTNKAAGEMKERVQDLVGFGSDSIWVSTFHSSCVRILRRYADRLGYDNSFTIYDTDDSKSVMKDICKKLQIDTKQLKERTILGAISSAKNEGILPDDYRMAAIGDYNKTKIANAYIEYQNTLLKNNAMDFDDLLVNAVELFKSNPDVLQNYQEKFLYIMVDEYQDTNSIQFEFIRLLAGSRRNLCVVGDDDQSIYKFRGANIRNILDFETIYPEAKVIKLEQNYRSTQTVLDAANAVISNNINRKSKALWTDKGMGNRIHFRQFDTAVEEAEYIAYDIAGKKNQGVADYKDCAVLYRTNAQARVLEEQFVHAGVPYDIVGGVNFYGRKEIKDLLAYLKTIDNGNDDLAVKRIINIPRRGIGATTIVKVQQYADDRGIGFYEALEESGQIMTIGKSASKLDSFVTMIQAFRAKARIMSLSDLVKDIIEITGYVEQIEANSDEDAQARIDNIDEFISKVVSFEEEHENATLSEFLAEVALVADIDNVDENHNKVLLMTLHSAKGLEFPHVYLAGMEDGLFPSYMSIMDGSDEEIAEERRLAYVGITRAKDDLTVTAAKMRMIRGETQYNPVSRFLQEIPQELIDNRIPKKKSFQMNEYVDDTFASAKKSFAKKPYQSVFGGSSPQEVYAKPRPVLSDDVFDKPKPVSSGNVFGQTEPKPVSSGNVFGQAEPKQVSSDNVFGQIEPKPVSGGNVFGQAEPKPVSSDNVFGQTVSKPVSSSNAFGQTSVAPGGYKPVVKPKAVLKKKETKAEVKPFIAKGITKGVASVPGTRPDYDIGDRVKHIKFGEGVVKAMEKGPRDYQVTVEFDTYGQKILFAAFAKLQKV